MKILVLNYEYPPLGGGAGVITQHISEGLALQNHNITIVTAWFKNLPEKEEKQNLTIIRLKSKRKYAYQSDVIEMISWISYSKKFLDTYCLKNTFDKCLANFALPGGKVALYLKKKFNMPFAVISHGHDIPWLFPKQMFWYHLGTYFSIKKICKNATNNIMLTKQMKDNIDKFLGKQLSDHNIIIPNGCDINFFVSDLSQKATVFKIIFIGRLVSQKDPFTFLKALKHLNGKKIPFIANIIGDGVLRWKMEKFVINNSLQNSVSFAGWLSKEQMLREYQSAHIFVQSSLYEAMSVATLEALACGTYVFCTPVGANKDIIAENENGDIFETGNYLKLSDKLSDYYNNKYLKGFKVDHKYVESIRSRYDWKNIILKYEQVLKNSTE